MATNHSQDSSTSLKWFSVEIALLNAKLELTMNDHNY